MADVEYRQVGTLNVRPESPSQLNIDGEMKGTAPFCVEAVPQALRVFC
jgi:diacylglycerol kinase family enzyme